MSFDMGFDFRALAAYVTDPNYGVPVLGEAYPHTYTNVNGDSCNAGWTGGAPGLQNLSNTQDVRLAGDDYVAPGTSNTFRATLPSASTYDIDVAFGDQGSARTFTTATITDNGSGLIAVSGTTGGANNFFDATGTNRAPGTGTWNGVTVNKTFATTTCLLTISDPASYTTIAHFRLTLAASGPTVAQELPAVDQLAASGGMVGRAWR